MDKDVLKTAVPAPLQNATTAAGRANVRSNLNQSPSAMNGPPPTPRMWPPPPPAQNTAPYMPWVDPFDVVWHLWLRYLGTGHYFDAGTYQAYTVAESDAPKRIARDNHLSEDYLILKAGETPRPKYK